MVCVWGGVSSAEDLPAFSPVIEREEPQEEALLLAPEQPTSEKLMYEAEMLVMDKEYASAIPLLEQVIALEPTRYAAWRSLAWSHWYLGDKERMREVCEQLLLIAPNEPRAYTILASYYMNKNEMQRCIELYKKSLELDPHQSDVRLYLGQVYSWSGYLQESIDILTPLLAEDPDRLDIRLALTRALTAKWYYDKALPHWELIRSLDPSNTDYMAQEALCRLHLGQVDTAVKLASQVLEIEGDSMNVLHILADAHQFQGEPKEALAVLYRMLALVEKPTDRNYIKGRQAHILMDLTYDDPITYPFQTLLDLGRDAVEADPKNAGAQIAYAELHVEAASQPHMTYASQEYLSRAEHLFLKVLKEYNPRNLRCQRGLFEVYMTQKRWTKAWEMLDAIRTFDPLDPYLNYYEATYHARHGDYKKAYMALDRLEQAGRRGAVAVLLGHSLGPSRFGQMTSKDEFREQLLGLRSKGYEFVTPLELKAYFASMNALKEVPQTGPVRRLAMVTFDDVLETSLIYGTPVLQELNIQAVQHIIVGNTDREEAYLASWDTIRKYKKTGVWLFGAHSYDAHRPYAVSRDESEEEEAAAASYDKLFSTGANADEEARYAYPFGNRIWLKKEDRLETHEEFRMRLQFEYDTAQRRIEEELGSRAVTLAYPFGEVGQETFSNEPNAIDWHKEIAGSVYDMGFIQSHFGHAVNGDDPMMYQRHEPVLRATGDDVAKYFLLKHPVYLAQRIRLQLAVDEGNYTLAEKTIAAMRDAGYPEEYEGDLDLFVLRHLKTKLNRSNRLISDGALFAWNVSDPLATATIEWFSDGLDSTHIRYGGGVEMNVAPNVELSVKAGAGTYEQDEAGGTEPRTLSIDEMSAEAGVQMLLPNSMTLGGTIGARVWSGDASATVPRVLLNAQGRLTDHTEWNAEYEHDAYPAARAMADETTFDRGGASTVWTVSQVVDFWTRLSYYRFSDGNNRYHLDLNPNWLVWHDGGLRLGLRYSYASSEEESNIYWTPYESHNFYLETTLTGGTPGLYYSLGAQVGMGRESIRPATEQLLSDAEKAGLPPPFDIDDDWNVVAGVQGYLYIDLGEHWIMTLNASYFQSPNYEETRAGSSLGYSF